jgi:hypothetical protein
MFILASSPRTAYTLFTFKAFALLKIYCLFKILKIVVIVGAVETVEKILNCLSGKVLNPDPPVENLWKKQPSFPQAVDS